MLKRFSRRIPGFRESRPAPEGSVRCDLAALTSPLSPATNGSRRINVTPRTRTPTTRMSMTARAGLIVLAPAALAAMVLQGSDELPGGRGDATPSLGSSSGQVYSTRARDRISVSELYRQLRGADYVLLGELHGHPVHHALQRQLLQETVRDGRKPTVVLEMLDRKDAGAIAIATAIRQSPREPDPIADAVDWKGSGWPDWRLYRPILQTALDAGLPIAAGNISRTELMQVIVGNGWEALGERTLRTYGLLQPLPPKLEQSLRATLDTAHGDLPDSVVDGMLKAQRLRDAGLAETMLARNQGSGAVLIAGREHVRQDYGVPHYLRYREPDATILSITFISADDLHPSTTTREDILAFDYLWLLPGSDAPVADAAVPSAGGSGDVRASSPADPPDHLYSEIEPRADLAQREAWKH